MANILLYNSWMGGISDDKYTGIANSFYKGKAVEIRENPLSVSLAHLTEKDSGTTITALPKDMITASNTGNLYVFGDSGKIYCRAYATGAWTLAYTDTGGDSISNAIEYNGYIYWTTVDKLHRIALTDADADWTGDVTEDFQTFTGGNPSNHPMIEINNKLYIGDGPQLAERDGTTFTVDKLQIFGDEEIMALTTSGSMLKIYSKRTSTVLTYPRSRCYFWNTIDDAYNEFVDWQGQDIKQVVTKEGVDYVVAGDYLFVSNGYDRQKLKKLPYVTTGATPISYTNAIDVKEGLILLGGSYGVWTWGALNKDYPEVLNFDYPTSQTYAETGICQIGAVHNSGGNIYIAYRFGSSGYAVDKINTAKYSRLGEVVSRTYAGQFSHQKKRPVRMFIACAPIATNEVVSMSINLDESGSYVGGTSISTVGDMFRESYEHENEFNYIDVKVGLLTTDGLTTPELKELGLEYEIVKNN